MQTRSADLGECHHEAGDWKWKPLGLNSAEREQGKLFWGQRSLVPGGSRAANSVVGAATPIGWIATRAVQEQLGHRAIYGATPLVIQPLRYCPLKVKEA